MAKAFAAEALTVGALEAEPLVVEAFAAFMAEALMVEALGGEVFF